jgi:hypothetical protein
MWIVGDEMHFYFAVQEIERRLGFSRGAAEKRLRELCASGEVRSWKKPYLDVGGGYAQPMAPEWERVLPSEWKTREVDLAADADGYENCVRVSKVDLEQQIGKTGTQRCIEVPIVPSRRSRWQQERVVEVMCKLWGPNWVPEGKLDAELLRELANACDRLPKPTPSARTQRRALDDLRKSTVAVVTVPSSSAIAS